MLLEDINALKQGITLLLNPSVSLTDAYAALNQKNEDGTPKQDWVAFTSSLINITAGLADIAVTAGLKAVEEYSPSAVLAATLIDAYNLLSDYQRTNKVDTGKLEALGSDLLSLTAVVAGAELAPLFVATAVTTALLSATLGLLSAGTNSTFDPNVLSNGISSVLTAIGNAGESILSSVVNGLIGGLDALNNSTVTLFSAFQQGLVDTGLFLSDDINSIMGLSSDASTSYLGDMAIVSAPGGQNMLTSSELATLESMFSQAQSDTTSDHPYSKIYSWLAQVLATSTNPDVLEVANWMKGAASANGDESSMFAVLIRQYTKNQGLLRGYNTDALMQTASNNVAFAAITQIIENQGVIPSISDIANDDATAVGQTLFSTDEGDSALTFNSAWSGSLLFSFLGDDQTYRLFDATASAQWTNVTVDTLKNVAFAFDSFNAAIASASGSELTLLASLFFDGFPGSLISPDFTSAANDLGITATEAGNLWELAKNGYALLTDNSNFSLTGQPPLSTFSSCIFAGIMDNCGQDALVSYIVNSGLPAVMNDLNASLGRFSGGSITASNYTAAATSLFAGTVVDDAIAVTFLPSLPPSIVGAQAQVDGGIQAALMSLSPVAATEPNNALQTRSYEFWAKRAEMTLAKYLQSNEGAFTEDMAVQHDLDAEIFVDDITHQTVSAAGLSTLSTASEVIFGADGTDTLRANDGSATLFGGLGHNQLYAGAGNDTLVSGGGGNLLVEGASVDSIYAQTGDVLDTTAGGDGAGNLYLNGALLVGGVWAQAANGWVDSKSATIYRFDTSGNLVVYAYDTASNKATGSALLTITGLQFTKDQTFKSWLNMGFFNSALTGGTWNATTARFESDNFFYYLNSDGTLTVTSADDPSQSIILPNASSYLGTSGTGSQTLHLTNGPSDTSADYIFVFDAVALMAGPQGLNFLTIGQVNNLVSAQTPEVLLGMVRTYLGLDSTTTVSDIASAGISVLSMQEASTWGDAYLSDRASALRYLLEQTDTSKFSVTYIDEASAFATAPSSMQSILGYFESSTDTNLDVGSGLQGTRIYAGSGNTTITGEALQNDYYVFPGDVIIDPDLRGLIHLPTDVPASSVSFTTNGNDLVINIEGTQPVIVKDMLARGQSFEEVSRGITNGTFSWSVATAVSLALNEYINDISSDSVSTLTGHAGFNDALHAGIGIDTLYGSKVLVDPVTGLSSSAPQTTFYLGSGQDTVFGSGYGYDTVYVTSLTGQAIIQDETGTTHLVYDDFFDESTLWVQLQGTQLVLTDAQGGAVTIDQGGPTVTLPTGANISSSTLYSDALSASQRKSLYEYLYDPNESGTESQFAAILEGLSADFTTYAAAGYFDTQLTRAVTAGYDVKGIEDGVSSVRYQNGQEIKTYSFSAVERNSAVSSQYATNAYVWESVTFDLWKDSTGVEHYALDNASTGYGTTVGSGQSTLPYSESPQQVVLQQRDTRFQLFGAS